MVPSVNSDSHTVKFIIINKRRIIESDRTCDHLAFQKGQPNDICRHNDLIGRMGGDEFAIMILNVSDFSVIEHTVQQLLKELHKSYEQNGKTVEVSASLGIVTAPEHGTTFEELYQKSDQMLYEVKRSVKNGYRLYQEKESEHETDFNCR